MWRLLISILIQIAYRTIGLIYWAGAACVFITAPAPQHCWYRQYDTNASLSKYLNAIGTGVWVDGISFILVSHFICPVPPSASGPWPLPGGNLRSSQKPKQCPYPVIKKMCFSIHSFIHSKKLYLSIIFVQRYWHIFYCSTKIMINKVFLNEWTEKHTFLQHCCQASSRFSAQFEKNW